MSMAKIKEQVKKWVTENKVKNDFLEFRQNEEYIPGIKNTEILNYLESNPGKINILLGQLDSCLSLKELNVWYNGQDVTLEKDDVEPQPLIMEIDFPTGELIVSDTLKFLGFDPDLYINLLSEKIRTTEVFAEQGFMYAYLSKSYPHVYKNEEGDLIFGRYYSSKEEALEDIYEENFSEGLLTTMKKEFHVSTDIPFTGIIDKKNLYLLAEKNLGMTKSQIEEMIKNNLNDDWNTITVKPGKYKITNNYIYEGDKNPTYLALERIGDISADFQIKYKKDYDKEQSFLSDFMESHYFDLYPNFFTFLLRSKLNDKKDNNYLDLIRSDYNPSDKLINKKKMEEFMIVSQDVKDIIRDTPVFNYSDCQIQQEFSDSATYVIFNDNGKTFSIADILKNIDKEKPIEYAFYNLVKLKTIMENSERLLSFKSSYEMKETKKDIGRAMLILANIIKKEEATHIFALLKNEFVCNYELTHSLHSSIIEKENKMLSTFEYFIQDKGLVKEDILKEKMRIRYGTMAKFIMPDSRKNRSKL